MCTFASLIVTEHTQGSLHTVSVIRIFNVMQLPVPVFNATDACCSQSVGRWCHRTDPWHFQKNKNKLKNKNKNKPPQNVKCKGPPWGKLMPNWLEGTPAFCVWIVYAPVVFHCEFSWCGFAGAHGSVSEGGHDWNTGSVSFQDFVFRCNRCLSDF